MSLDVKNILDSGCGEGIIIDVLLSKTGKNICIEGVDINKDVLEAARKLNPAVRFNAGDINNLDYPDNSFDLVIAIEVFEHLDDPGRALLEIKRISKKYIVISVPHEPFFMIGNFLRGKFIRRCGNHPGHINHWTKKRFTRFLTDHCPRTTVTGSFPWLIGVCEK